jgi:tetratricopeptide (TPR) repeat protein
VLQRIGAFEFDPERLTLTRGGELVRLPRKALELLAALAREPGSLVASDALRETLWPGGFIEDKNLTQQVYVLRRALALDRRIRIENVPRCGYRLVAPAPLPAPIDRGSRLGWVTRWAALGFAAAITLGVARGAANGPLERQFPQAAAEAYARGVLLWERRDRRSLASADREFRRTVDLAPRDARGYAGLALVAVVRVSRMDSKGKDMSAQNADYARATELVRETLARDPRNADAFDVLGLVAELRDRDTQRAERLFLRAQALDERNVYGHVWRGILLLNTGRLNEALAELGRGEQLSPGSLTAASWLASAEYYRRDFDAAGREFRTVLEIDADNPEAKIYLAVIDEARHDYVHAEQRLLGLSAHVPVEERAPMLARLEALRGRYQSARGRLAEIRTAKGVDPVELASAQLAVGERRAALATLRSQPVSKRADIRNILRWDVRFAALRQFALENRVESVD